MSRTNSKKSKRDELLDSFSRRIHALSTADVMLTQAIAEHLGINMTDFKCGELLHEMGPLSAGQLSALTGLTTGAVTGIIDRLEKKGFVKRKQSPDDRRSIIVEPLPSGFRDAQKFFTSLRNRSCKKLSLYNDNELAVILDYVTHTTTMLNDEAAKLRKKMGASKKRKIRKGKT